MSVKNRLKSYILSRSIGDHARKIGIEVECFLFNKNGKRIPVNKGDVFSASDLLEELSLKSKNSVDQYSLEPGGQIEWASPVFEKIQDLESSFFKHKNSLENILKREGLHALYIGVDPFNEPSKIELINHKKYRLMNSNMDRKGTLGKWMMRNTSSIQINYDIKSEKDLEETTYILDCLHPILSYLFCYSPFRKREIIHDLNFRNHIWENTDNDRCRSLINHGIWEQEGLLDLYCDFVCGVPGIFKIDNKYNIQGTNISIGEELNNKYLKGELRNQDIKISLHQIFTNVRLKTLIELRDIDCLPVEYIMAPVAFTSGLITSKSIRTKLLNLFNNWTFDEKVFWNKLASSLNKNQMGPDNKKFIDWVKFFGDLSLEGLAKRTFGEEKYFLGFFNNIILNGTLSEQYQKKVSTSSEPFEKLILR
ncbi:MAG: glutamate-cysteine ligase family protein [Candidatus Neomarinimicrobiota bacterium]